MDGHVPPTARGRAAVGTPEDVVNVKRSHMGQFLKPVWRGASVYASAGRGRGGGVSVPISPVRLKIFLSRFERFIVDIAQRL